MPLIMPAQLKTFSDWIKADSINYLSGRFGRAPGNDLNTDHIGFLRYYPPQLAPTGIEGLGVRLIPGDFLGVLTASDGSQAIVSLAAGDPVSMAAQFIGGAIDGLSVQSEMVIYVDGIGEPDIWMYFADSGYEYALQIVKLSHLTRRIHKLPR
jgi:hypothetical protein